MTKNARNIMILSGVSCVFMWFTDAFISSIFFSKGTVARLLFGAEGHELYFRLYACLGFFFFGVVSARLISKREQSEKRLKESEGRLQAIFENAAIGMVVANAKREIMDCNPAFVRMLGYTREELPGMSPALLSHPEDEEENVFLINEALRTKQKSFRMEKRYRKKDGTFIVGDLTLSIIYNDLYEPELFVAMINDITERKRMEDAVKYQASHDYLTGLPNRMLLMEHLDLALTQARRKKHPVAVMYLDLDRFKPVNDSLGHSVGDQLLGEVTCRLRGCVREGDTIARIGGDEFTILLPEITQADDVAKVAKKILSIFQNPFLISGYELYVTASIGISIYPDTARHAETLLQNADIAMYHAKEHGRNNYQFYSTAMDIKTLERMILENSLRQTLKRGELVLYYQPVVDISTRKIIAAEALVRWRHPERGLLNPEQFIPLAEETGLIVSIDEWVLRTACSQVKTWHDEGFPELHVMVNISDGQFQRAAFVDMVEQVVQEAGLEPQHLELEITESIAMHNVKDAAGKLERLHQGGIKLAIDDFGTGYSSLSRLMRLPVNKVKIDKSFINSLTTDSSYRAMVSAIITMAHNLDLKVIAEGIENDDQLDFLRAETCDELQGYLFSEPVSQEEFKKLLLLYKDETFPRCK